MGSEGTGVQSFRSKLRLSKDDAKNYEAACLMADSKFYLIVIIGEVLYCLDTGANTKAGSFCGAFLTYSRLDVK